ncbi:hypothetical protein [Rhodococcus sp. C-2]|uniref:hypothetical protein n=1 Tax=Rhodococcus sp. C-2 TaxID=3018809 RepID=UPI0022EA7468|nr:hypothetical protein [Rhodococcus sp. C-2]MDA3635403.1 hypothetical protein [Rhodococcus sp. C-2]
MTIERHQSVIDTDYHQFMIEAGPLRELIHRNQGDSEVTKMYPLGKSIYGIEGLSGQMNLYLQWDG